MLRSGCAEDVSSVGCACASVGCASTVLGVRREQQTAFSSMDVQHVFKKMLEAGVLPPSQNFCSRPEVLHQNRPQHRNKSVVQIREQEG